MKLEWLLAEHKEPIKLKQLEYDLIDEFVLTKRDTFDDFSVLSCMKSKGHFKGLNDKNMICQEILDNCIIVADDYDFGGNEQ